MRGDCTMDESSEGESCVTQLMKFSQPLLGIDVGQPLYGDLIGEIEAYSIEIVTCECDFALNLLRNRSLESLLDLLFASLGFCRMNLGIVKRDVAMASDPVAEVIGGATKFPRIGVRSAPGAARRRWSDGASTSPHCDADPRLDGGEDEARGGARQAQLSLRI